MPQVHLIKNPEQPWFRDSCCCKRSPHLAFLLLENVPEEKPHEYLTDKIYADNSVQRLLPNSLQTRGAVDASASRQRSVGVWATGCDGAPAQALACSPAHLGETLALPRPVSRTADVCMPVLWLNPVISLVLL